MIVVYFISISLVINYLGTFSGFLLNVAHMLRPRLLEMLFNE